MESGKGVRLQGHLSSGVNLQLVLSPLVQKIETQVESERNYYYYIALETFYIVHHLGKGLPYQEGKAVYDDLGYQEI